MESDKLLRLLIVENSRNAAQAYIHALRNARFAVRASVAEDEEDIEDLLAKQSFDLMLTIEEPDGISLPNVFAVVEGLAPDLPVVVATENFNASNVLRVMRLGAHGVFDRDSDELLQCVIGRELVAVQSRRALADTRDALHESERRCLSLLGNSRDAIAYVHEGMHVYANNSYLELFGFAAIDEIESTPMLDMIAPQDHERCKILLRRFSRGKCNDEGLVTQGVRPDGSRFPAKLELSPAVYDGERCTQIIIHDETSSMELERKLSNLSKQDALTGLYNRQYFMERLQAWIDNAADGPTDAAVFYIAIDSFRSVKERIGIASTDRVIADVADLLVEHVTEQDLLARFGDHTFTLLCRGRSSDEIMRLADAYRTALQEKLFEVGERAVSITCSIGINPTEGARNAQEAVAMADLACESAISGGGNAVKIHDAVTHARQSRERDRLLVEMIRAAGKKGRFRLYYQPIVSLRGEPSENYEVLLRMVDDKGEQVPPSQFIPAAERSGQIASIERWVIANTIHVAAKRANSTHTNFFVNLSAVSLSDTKLIPWLQKQLNEEKLPAEHLVFEISEDAITNHISEARAFTKALSRMGCRISVDHFGASTSSFITLREIDAHFLKLDRSLIQPLKNDSSAQQRVRAIADQGHDLGKQVIAEFVEDANILSVLWQTNVDYIQGFFLQEPSASMNFDFEGESL